MIKFNVRKILFLGMCIGCTSLPSIAYGQTQTNAFDDTLNLVENPVVEKKTSKLELQKSARPAFAQARIKAPESSAIKLQYKTTLEGGPVQAKNLLDTLTSKYGAPTSVRGQSYVWDIGNPNRGGTQAKTITIILKYNPNGVSELIMDRDKGEDGRATYAAPRRTKPVTLQAQEQKQKTRPTPKFVNND